MMAHTPGTQRRWRTCWQVVEQLVGALAVLLNDGNTSRLAIDWGVVRKREGVSKLVFWVPNDVVFKALPLKAGNTWCQVQNALQVA